MKGFALNAAILQVTTLTLISVALDFKIQLLFKTILHHDAAILQVTTLKVVDLKFPTRHKYETF